jgi:hypothetical protein
MNDAYAAQIAATLQQIAVELQQLNALLLQIAQAVTSRRD